MKYSVTNVKAMSETDVYERLRAKISAWPVRVPRTREVMKILRILFTEEEAEFLTHFEAPYQDRETMDQIVERTGKPREKARAMVDSLVTEGLLFRFTSKSDGNVYYSLMPMIPGIFEYYFVSVRDSDEKTESDRTFRKILYERGWHGRRRF